MKIAVNILFSLIVFLFSIVNVIAKTTPPSPTGKSAATMAPPPPPELAVPVDQGLALLFVIALLYGVYIIYNHHLKTKTPI